MEKVTEKENEAISMGKCPDCGGQLYITSRGGEAKNVECGCGSKFWVGYPFTPERIAKGTGVSL
ncbi:hypothetical protein ES705_44371 [subsurface metagenome]